MTWLEQFIKAVNLLLSEGAALSILLGYVIAIGGTQYIKSFEAIYFKPLAIRALMALPLGFVATFFTLPIEGRLALRAVIAAAVGLTAPAVYSLTIRVLYHFWPWMETKISQQPPKPEDPKP